MAKRAKRSRKRRGTTIPIAVIAPLAAEGFKVGGALISGDTRKAAEYLVADYTGYNINSNDFRVDRLKHGLLPLLIGGGVHKLASKLGINRMLASSGVPWIRI